MDYPNAYVMIEFNVGDRRMRLYPDGKITCRSQYRGEETKNENWYSITFREHKGYTMSYISVNGKMRHLSKHRLLHLARNPGWNIFDTSKDNCIDHINHTRDDNSIENLRVVTNQQNHFNRSGVKGYTWDKKRNKWQASIGLNGKNEYLGLFEKEEDARAAYLEAKARLHVMPEVS